MCNFISVYKNGVSLTKPGDSGGPVYIGNTALGIIHGFRGDQMVYMPQNRMAPLDLVVLTS